MSNTPRDDHLKTMTETAEQRLESVCAAALNRYARVMEEDYPGAVRLTVKPYDGFQALAVPEGDGVRIIVSSGVVDAVKVLWQTVLSEQQSSKTGQRLNAQDVDQAIDASLEFLILHELHHHYLEHFKLSGPSGIAETSLHDGFGLTSRDGPEPSGLDHLAPDQRRLYRRCMELQADHDAMEVLFDAWSMEGWAILRFYAAAVFIVMVLIEREEQCSQDQSNHPKAATRMFQMLGFLARLWVPFAQHSGTMASEKDLAAYHREVIAPALDDAKLIAEIANPAQTAEVISTIEDFLEDLERVQERQSVDLSKLKTQGAREYAELSPINAEVIALLDPDKFF